RNTPPPNRANRLDPRRDLVGHPLPVAVLRPRPEVAAGDLREVAREARVPAPLGDRVCAVEVRPLRDARAEAGRADERAVRARQAALRDLGPARVVEVVDEPAGQT